MNDDELDRMIQLLAPRSVSGPDLDGAGHQLLEEIMSLSDTSSPDQLDENKFDLFDEPHPGVGTSSRWGRRRRALIGLAAAATVAAAVTIPVAYLRGGPSQVVEIAPAATENGVPAPGLLLADPAFTIRYAQGSVATQGSVQFADGKRSLEVTWQPKDQYQAVLDDRREVSKPRTVPVLGLDAQEVRYNATDFAVTLPPQGETFYEIRATVGDRAAFEAVLGRLEHVTQAEWNAAMPPGVVTPEREKKVAAELLADVPPPPGFDVAKLRTGQTNDRYQFSARVLGQAACGWIDEYLTADQAGDADQAAKAQQVLKGSHDWAGLKAMVDEGDYAELLWEYADAVAKGTPVKAGTDVTVANSYQDALGCN